MRGSKKERDREGMTEGSRECKLASKAKRCGERMPLS